MSGTSSEMNRGAETFLSTCPRDCYDACGLVVVKENDVVVQVKGDPQHPVSRGKLCRKCSIGYNSFWLDPTARLTPPLRRTGTKGQGGFEPVSWDEVIAANADRLKQVVATSGAETILNTHYTGTFASEHAEKDGFPLVPEPHADKRPDGGHLRLLSPASPWTLNDTFGNGAKIEKQLGPAYVLLHPDDADQRGLSEGEQVSPFNDTGELALQLKLSTNERRGVALSYKGRWPKRQDSQSNINVLNPGDKSDMGESSCVHAVEFQLVSI